MRVLPAHVGVRAHGALGERAATLSSGMRQSVGQRQRGHLKALLVDSQPTGAVPAAAGRGGRTVRARLVEAVAALRQTPHLPLRSTKWHWEPSVLCRYNVRMILNLL